MTESQRQRAAQALVTALVKGDRAAAKEHKCSTRTLRRWRKAVEDDPEMAAAVREAKEVTVGDIGAKLTAGIDEAVEFMRRAFKEGDPANPDMLHAVAGAFKLLSEADTTRRVLDVRLARSSGSPGAQPFQVVAGGRG